MWLVAPGSFPQRLRVDVQTVFQAEHQQQFTRQMGAKIAMQANTNLIMVDYAATLALIEESATTRIRKVKLNAMNAQTPMSVQTVTCQAASPVMIYWILHMCL